GTPHHFPSFCLDPASSHHTSVLIAPPHSSGRSNLLTCQDHLDHQAQETNLGITGRQARILYPQPSSSASLDTRLHQRQPKCDAGSLARREVGTSNHSAALAKPDVSHIASSQIGQLSTTLRPTRLPSNQSNSPAFHSRCHRNHHHDHYRYYHQYHHQNYFQQYQQQLHARKRHHQRKQLRKADGSNGLGLGDQEQTGSRSRLTELASHPRRRQHRHRHHRRLTDACAPAANPAADPFSTQHHRHPPIHTVACRTSTARTSALDIGDGNAVDDAVSVCTLSTTSTLSTAITDSTSQARSTSRSGSSRHGSVHSWSGDLHTESADWAGSRLEAELTSSSLECLPLLAISSWKGAVNGNSVGPRLRDKEKGKLGTKVDLEEAGQTGLVSRSHQSRYAGTGTEQTEGDVLDEIKPSPQDKAISKRPHEGIECYPNLAFDAHEGLDSRPMLLTLSPRPDFSHTHYTNSPGCCQTLERPCALSRQFGTDSHYHVGGVTATLTFHATHFDHLGLGHLTYFICPHPLSSFRCTG
ncbi:unnamed protein product, partial [Protopolystoma xenopodis]